MANPNVNKEHSVGIPSVGKYPPTEFSSKYAAVLAPKGKLVSPSDIFGESGVFGEDVEEKTKQAFKVTMKKLDKINTKSDVVKEEIARERIDQVRFGFFFKRKPHQKSCKSLPNLLSYFRMKIFCKSWTFLIVSFPCP